MALAWATEAAFDRLCKENFDGNGSVKVDAPVPVLAKGTFAVVFKVPPPPSVRCPRAAQPFCLCGRRVCGLTARIHFRSCMRNGARGRVAV